MLTAAPEFGSTRLTSETIELPEVNVLEVDATSATWTTPCGEVSPGPMLVIRVFARIVSPGCMTGGTSSPTTSSSGRGASISTGIGLLIAWPWTS